MVVASRKVTYEELCAMPDDGILYELLDGVLVTRASPTPAHQQVVSRLSRIFEPVEDAALGIFYPGPLDVVFDQHNMTLPDGIFVIAARQSIVTGTGVHGAPDLVMEILSPTSLDRDWSDKYATYQRIGVRSYWIIDLTERHLHRFDLVDGRYAEQVLLGYGDTVVSPLFPGVPFEVGRLLAGGRASVPARAIAQERPSRIDPPQPVDPDQVARLERWHVRRQRPRERTRSAVGPPDAEASG
jgi:Uma2 family endonuclease